MRVDRICKIKVLSDGKARLQLAWDHADDEFDVKFCDEPRPELYEAMAGLVPHVLRLLELPASYEDGLSCTGLSLTWKHDILGAVVTCQKRLQGADAPLVLNTPHLPEVPYGESAGGALLPEGMVKALSACMAEAKRYIQGERAQMDLFPAHQEPDDEGDQELKERLDETLKEVGIL